MNAWYRVTTVVPILTAPIPKDPFFVLVPMAILEMELLAKVNIRELVRSIQRDGKEREFQQKTKYSVASLTI